jgi:hypothetical protein
VALCVSALSFGQSIGILGGSTEVGWDSDLDMTTTDGVVYTYNNLVINVPANDPGVKFRQDDAWTTNWGGSGFPAGTASLNGSNIPAVNGTYNVTFNLSTLQYSFVATGFNTIAIIGDGVNIELLTTDGITYVLNNVSLPAGDYDFYMNGVLMPDAGTSVDGNSYNITFNAQTGESTFDFVTISMIGLGVVTEDPGWVTDVDMETEDGVNYTLSNHMFPGGEGKFRLNHDWATAWGSSDFPSGTASTAGDAPNLMITAGAYDVTFNRESGEYSFAEVTAGIEDFASASVIVYPNPAQGVWNFNAASVIDGITIYDVTGKVVFASAFNNASVTVNANDFATGMYYATVTSAASQKTVKLAKK